jgi:hypothetical protein
VHLEEQVETELEPRIPRFVVLVVGETRPSRQEPGPHGLIYRKECGEETWQMKQASVVIASHPSTFITQYYNTTARYNTLHVQ